MQADATRELIEQIRQEITPTAAEKQKMEKIAATLEHKVMSACKEFGVDAIVRVEGSVAKDTWLKGDPDIDIFMRLPLSIPRKSLGEISLKVARRATEGSRQIERFAEHPYLEAYVEDTRVNVVPCYDATPGEWQSATDRTPFHTDYINKHMSRNMRDEVRLLKKFMKGIGVYGAEIRVGGFSGYLCELLILHYGSFTLVLEAFAHHMPKRTIDIEGYYKDRPREAELLFPEPLVIVDPVDKGRNVASAVQPQKLQVFAAASQAFLKAPRREFFYPPITSPMAPDVLKQKLESYGSDIIFLAFNGVQAVPDILWGQLYKTKRSLHKLLELSDFNVLRDSIWHEEGQECTVMVFELEQHILPIAKKHLGPPLTHEKECEHFLSKYSNNEKVLAGPYVEEGRWVVHVPRKYTDAVELLKIELRTGGRNAGVAELISHALRKEFEILVNSEIISIYQDKTDFAKFLTDFLKGKPFWL
jgi:tRNA nucleotidyltransferase (CCA-adding enzyme)